jgi:hypothetical protein
MLKKINKLILFSKKENNEIYNKLVSIAQKIENRLSSGENYLSLNTKVMEGLIDASKVDVEKGLGQIGVEV